MNQKEIAEWIEDRGELMLMKKDGEGKGLSIKG